MQRLFAVVNDGKAQEDDAVRAILVIGEIGTFRDLSEMKDIIPMIAKQFTSQSDLIRNAAAISLGSITIGNTNFFLEQVFKMISTAPP